MLLCKSYKKAAIKIARAVMVLCSISSAGAQINNPFP